MEVPSTVETALADRPVDGRACLEAGAGAGNATAGLLAAGAAAVYAVTNDREHATTVADRFDDDRLSVLEGDLRSLPMTDDAVGLVVAHGLFNVVPAADAAAIVAEIDRVAAPGAGIVVDDYAPLPEEARIRELFAVENAAAELAGGRPALTFYPPAHLAALFEARGWTVERDRTLLDPVPWTAAHVAAHREVAVSHAADLPASVGDPLAARAERLADEIGEERSGRMYSLALR